MRKISGSRLILATLALSAGLAVSAAAQTPTPTPLGIGAQPLIAIDNVAASGTQQLSTNFDTVGVQTLAEDLLVTGITFSPDFPGTWEVAAASSAPFGAPFRTLAGNVLLQPSTPGTLIIAFTPSVTSFSCTFALNAPPDSAVLTVQGFSGTTQVGSVSQVATGTGRFGEGMVQFAAAVAVDRVRLSSGIAGLTPTATAATASPTPTPSPTSGGVVQPPINPSVPCCGGTPAAGVRLPNTDNGCAIAAQPEESIGGTLAGVAVLILVARSRKRWQRAAARRF